MYINALTKYNFIPRYNRIGIDNNILEYYSLDLGIILFQYGVTYIEKQLNKMIKNIIDRNIDIDWIKRLSCNMNENSIPHKCTICGKTKITIIILKNTICVRCLNILWNILKKYDYGYIDNIGYITGRISGGIIIYNNDFIKIFFIRRVFNCNKCMIKIINKHYIRAKGTCFNCESDYIVYNIRCRNENYIYCDWCIKRIYSGMMRICLKYLLLLEYVYIKDIAIYISRLLISSYGIPFRKINIHRSDEIMK